MITLGGLPFDVGPAAALSPEERRLLLTLDRPLHVVSAVAPAFRLELSAAVPWEGCDLETFPDFAPAAVEVVGEGIRVIHRRFAAEIRPAQRRGILLRRHATGGALQVALRVALSSWLPEQGGLPLHAAGVRLGERGIVFFGPSGAGKSTLASSSPHPVLSDELVVVAGRPFALRPAGFWGALDPDAVRADPAATIAGRQSAPRESRLVALVELSKAPAFEWQRLSAETALRRLLGVVLVPPSPRLWRDVIGLLDRLVREVPCYRMAWQPRDDPWERIARACRE